MFFADIIGLMLGLLSARSIDKDMARVTLAPETISPRVLGEATEPRPVPRLQENTAGPDVLAGSYLVVDLESGQMLAERDAASARPIASLTKLLTALTIVNDSGYDPERVLTVSGNAVAAGRQGAAMDLLEGEQLRVRDLLAGMLINSANDAAVALAEGTAGTEKDFAERMNETAKNLGLTETAMKNASGLDEEGHVSSARDVALMMAASWTDPQLGIYLRAAKMTVSSADGKTSHELTTTNKLLGVRADILAGKTGYTDAAGQNLAVVAEEDGAPIAAVVLGSTDRFGDMENLINWTFWAYNWTNESQ